MKEPQEQETGLPLVWVMMVVRQEEREPELRDLGLVSHLWVNHPQYRVPT